MSTRSAFVFLNVLQVSLFHFCHSAGSHDLHDHSHDWWDYGLRGPSHWCNECPECCGNRQSPINVDTTSAEQEDFLPLRFDGYKAVPTEMKLTNTGHSIQASVFYPNVKPTISDGGFGDENYTLVGFHFHWGSNDGQGSEHTLNGMRYPLELHMVHTNTKYPHRHVEVDNPARLAVLSILYTVAENDNKWLNDIINNMEEVMYCDDTANVKQVNFTLMDLLPRWTDHFYRYMGSLTTPQCNETVIWTVFSATQTISQRQLNIFREMKTSTADHNNTMMSDNFRPVQAINGRIVFQSRTSTSPKISNQSILLVFLVFLTLLYV